MGGSSSIIGIRDEVLCQSALKIIESMMRSPGVMFLRAMISMETVSPGLEVDGVMLSIFTVPLGLVSDEKLSKYMSFIWNSTMLTVELE